MIHAARCRHVPALIVFCLVVAIAFAVAAPFMGGDGAHLALLWLCAALSWYGCLRRARRSVHLPMECRR